MNEVLRNKSTKVRVKFRTPDGYKTKTVTTDLLTNKYTTILLQPMFDEVAAQLRSAQSNIISFVWFQHI